MDESDFTVTIARSAAKAAIPTLTRLATSGTHDPDGTWRKNAAAVAQELEAVLAASDGGDDQSIEITMSHDKAAIAHDLLLCAPPAGNPDGITPEAMAFMSAFRARERG